MSTPHHHVLAYYQTPAFADSSVRHARTNYDAAYRWLRMTFEQLAESHRKLAPPTSEAVSLSQLIDGPLSIEQLVAMIRTYAHKLATLLA